MVTKIFPGQPHYDPFKTNATDVVAEKMLQQTATSYVVHERICK
jgi:hypothetical protein